MAIGGGRDLARAGGQFSMTDRRILAPAGEDVEILDRLETVSAGFIDSAGTT